MVEQEVLRIVRAPNGEGNLLGYQVEQLIPEHLYKFSWLRGWCIAHTRNVWRPVGKWYAMREYAEIEFKGRWDVLKFKEKKCNSS